MLLIAGGARPRAAGATTRVASSIAPASVGYRFRDALAAAAIRHDTAVGQLMQQPIQALVRYHEIQ